MQVFSLFCYGCFQYAGSKTYYLQARIMLDIFNYYWLMAISCRCVLIKVVIIYDIVIMFYHVIHHNIMYAVEVWVYYLYR
eukprot:UN00757